MTKPFETRDDDKMFSRIKSVLAPASDSFFAPCLLLLVASFSVGCASVPPEPEASSDDVELFPELRNKRPYESGGVEPVRIDYDGLQRSLGMNRTAEHLGYHEKEFATCEAGYGYSSTHSCQTHRFVVIGFQLYCRQSEGSVSTTLRYEDMQPLSGRTVNWELKSDRGTVVLDTKGRGQLRGVFPSSPRSNRLRIATRGDFLYMQAGEIRRVIAPSKWCD